MESFEELSQKYSPMIHRIIHSLNIYKNKEEYLQLGLISLWKASQRYNFDKGNFSSYAYSYVRGSLMNEMTTKNQKEEKMVYPKNEFWELIEDDSPVYFLEEDLLFDYCRRSKLSENQTKWVLYTFIKGFSVRDIADIENLSISAVKRWKEGAMEKLKKRIKVY